MVANGDMQMDTPFRSYTVISRLIYGGVVLLILIALWLAYQHIAPPTPKKVVIAAGETSGAYYNYAKQYAKYFAGYGIELEILETNGSVENLSLIAGENNVDAAFMQGGIADPDDYPYLNSLGSLYYEPLWVFFNAKQPIYNAQDVKGKRVSIGPIGSGTNYIFKDIIAKNNITEENTSILEIKYKDALPDLLKGIVDVLCISTGINSDIIQYISTLGHNVQLFSYPRAKAYASSRHHLTQLVLPQGALNLATNKPSKNVNLIASTANLIVKEDIHPAIEYLFLLAANNIHQQGDIFSPPGQFPNMATLLFPLSDEAKNFYTNGPPILLHYLPFQLAITFERLGILLIPLLVILYPLFKITPIIFRWQNRRRIYKWYKHLNRIDLHSCTTKNKKEARKFLSKLKRLDQKVIKTSVPQAYADYKYSLRLHISLIEARLETTIVQTQKKPRLSQRSYQISHRKGVRNKLKFNLLHHKNEQNHKS